MPQSRARTPTRLLTRLFIRHYLSPDAGGESGTGPNVLATSVALIVSPGLFLTVIMATKYVLTPFPNPGETALSSLFDHLLFFSTSWVALALVAIVQWDRLALDTRDANILGILPIPTRQIVYAKWKATAWLACAAAGTLNALPSLIYPLVSVARLEASGPLVLWLAVWHFVVAVSAGVTGFLAVLVVRELLWVACGPRRFGSVSAGVQAVLVVVLVAALFLLPPFSADALRRGTSWAQWLPNVGFSALFEAGGGRLIVDLPSPDLPAAIAERARQAGNEYRAHARTLDGVATTTLVACGIVTVCAVLLAAWNGRRLPPSVPAAGARRRWSSLASRIISRSLVRRPAMQAGFFLGLRTLTRSQPHRLVLAGALAVGLAAGAVGVVGQPRPGRSLAEAPIAFLAVQHLLVISLVAGLRVALRRAADGHASWVFSLAWDADRLRYASGVGLAGGVLVGIALLVLVPLHARFLSLSAIVLHVAIGTALCLVLVEVVLATEGTVPLTTSVPTSESTKAFVALGVPLAVGMAAGVAAVERVAPALAVTSLVATWGLLHLVRRGTLSERQPWRAPDDDEMQGLGLFR